MANKSIRLSDGTNWLFPQSATLIPKTRGAGDDLNSLYNDYDSGFYQITTGVTNSPATWCKLIVIGGTGCMQFVVNVGTIFFRMYTGSPLAWSPWRYVSGTLLS